MSKIFPKYGISLENQRIAWFTRTERNSWRVEDSFDVEGLSRDEIRAKFTPIAARWAKMAKRIALWLSDDIAHHVVFEGERSLDEVFLEMDITNQNQDEFVFFHKKSRKSHYLAIDKEFAELARTFVEERGFTPTYMGCAKPNLDLVSPDLYPMEFAGAVRAEPKIAPFEQLNLALEASVHEEDTDDQFERGESEKKTAFAGSFIEHSRAFSERSDIWLLAFAIGIIALGLIFFALIRTGVIFGAVESESLEAPDEMAQNVNKGFEETQSSNEAPDGEGADTFVFPKFDGILPQRPNNHTEVVNLREAEIPLIFNHLPLFDTPKRPDDHAEYVDRIMAQGAEAIRPEATGPALPVDDETLVTSSQTAAQSGDAILLLGIIGKASAPDALIQNASGEVIHVRRGDVVDGWKIVAIGKDQVILTNGGSEQKLTVPTG